MILNLAQMDLEKVLELIFSIKKVSSISEASSKMKITKEYKSQSLKRADLTAEKVRSGNVAQSIRIETSRGTNRY